MNFRDIVPESAWQELIARGRRRPYRRGTQLLRQGESATSVIALTEGIVKVVQSAENGDTLTLMLRGPGEVLGEMGALLDRRRSATIQAVSACVGYVLPAHAFRGYVDRHRLTTEVYRLAVDRMQENERLRSDLVRLPPAARLARVVACLAREIGRPVNDGVLVELGMPREELAAMAAMSRSTAMPVLNRLRVASVLSLGRSHLIVLDPVGLEAAAAPSAEPGRDSAYEARHN
ncbi:Crp/Fnr family transcriptional regulator [Embleya sp. AB8]|uniref:Crp/Fnr family transcriptional regulator n=1 Tax=Embleya sp. AB8 TaxID=3156304 RepID=UPI003C70841C